MRLYVKDRDYSNRKIYLSEVAETRQQLAYLLNSDFFRIENQYYSVNEVVAEMEFNNQIINTTVSVGLGALFLGAVGAVTGLVSSAVFAATKREKDLKKVEVFNKS